MAENKGNYYTNALILLNNEAWEHLAAFTTELIRRIEEGGLADDPERDPQTTKALEDIRAAWDRTCVFFSDEVLFLLPRESREESLNGPPGGNHD